MARKKAPKILKQRTATDTVENVLNIGCSVDLKYLKHIYKTNPAFAEAELNEHCDATIDRDFDGDPKKLFNFLWKHRKETITVTESLTPDWFLINFEIDGIKFEDSLEADMAECWYDGSYIDDWENEED